MKRIMTKHTFLIAAVVAGLFGTMAFLPRGDVGPVFDHLARHPRPCRIARKVSALVRQQVLFDKLLAEAQLRRGFYYGGRLQIDVF